MTCHDDIMCLRDVTPVYHILSFMMHFTKQLFRKKNAAKAAVDVLRASIRLKDQQSVYVGGFRMSAVVINWVEIGSSWIQTDSFESMSNQVWKRNVS